MRHRTIFCSSRLTGWYTTRALFSVFPIPVLLASYQFNKGDAAINRSIYKQVACALGFCLQLRLTCKTAFLNEENKTFKFERHVSATPVPSSAYGWNYMSFKFKSLVLFIKIVRKLLLLRPFENSLYI